MSILIDLGEVPPPGRPVDVTAAPVRRPVRRRRMVPAVLAAVLVAMLTGAARIAPWDAPQIVPARLGDIMFVDGDRLFVVGAGPEQTQTKIVRTYALPAGRQLSLTTVAGVTGAIYDVTAVAGMVFVSYQTDAFGAVATVAVAAGTDRELWRRPAQVVAVSRTAGLVLLRENHFDVGALHWYGIDLASGALRWTLTQPVDGYIAETDYVGGFPRRLVSLDVTGRLVVRDSVTSTVVAATTIAAPADWARSGVALWPDGDLILVGDHVTATAYTLSGLTERWHAPVDLYTSYVGTGCGAVICLFSPGGTGIRVLDRITGRVRWASDRWGYSEQLGPYLLVGTEEGVGPDPAPAVLDSGTGRLRGSLRPWQTIGAARPGGGVVVLRAESSAGLVWYGVLDPVRLSARLLGVAERVYGDCQTTPDVLVCRRLDASVGIWRFAAAA
jgi:hypothetical protein